MKEQQQQQQQQQQQEAEEITQPPERLVSGTYSIISQLTDPTSLVESVPSGSVETPQETLMLPETNSLDLDDKAASMPPPLQRNVSIHEQKGFLLQSPGAVSISGSSSSDAEPASGAQQDEQEQPSYEESYTTTAIAISNEDLESEIRGRILQNAVQASHIEAEKPGQQKRNLGMVVCLAIAAILAAVLVTRLLLIQPDQEENSVPTFSPQPTSAPSTPLPTLRPTVSPTYYPTAAPTTDRNRLLAEYLRPLSFDQGQSINTPGTPQSNAFRTVVARRNLYPGEDLVTTYALLVVFESMQGSRWTNNTNWYSGSSVCSWHGVTCQPSSQMQRKRLLQPDGIEGDNDGMKVAGLRLSNNQLLGTIPPEVALLSLEILDLGGNRLVDNIPSELKDLKQIKYLNLQGNELFGSIPESLCASGVIVQVDCAMVACSCCIPDCSVFPPATAPPVSGPVADMMPSFIATPAVANLPPWAIGVPTYAATPSVVTNPVLSPLATPGVPTLPTLPTLSTLPTSPTLPSLPSLPTVPTLPSLPSLPASPTVVSVPTLPTLPSLPSLPTAPSSLTLPTLPSLPATPTVQTQPTVPTSPVQLPTTQTIPSAPQAPVLQPVPTTVWTTPAPSSRLNAPVSMPVISPVTIPAPSPVVTVPEDGIPVSIPTLRPVQKPAGYPPTIIPPFSIPAQLPIYAPNAPRRLHPRSRPFLPYWSNRYYNRP